MARNGNNNKSGALGFEAILWSVAEKLKGNMDAAEYKHVVLGLIFLKYISDAFEEKHAALLKDKSADAEDRDEYTADNVFWVNKIARWSYLLGRAKQPTIGKDLDDAMVAVEKDNPTLKSVLPKEYARPALDKHRLGELIDLVGTIRPMSDRIIANIHESRALVELRDAMLAKLLSGELRVKEAYA